MKIHFHKISDTWYWCESSTHTLVTYDLHMREHGFECNCYHFARNYLCKHVDALCEQLYGIEPVLPARVAVKRAKLTLEDLYR